MHFYILFLSGDVILEKIYTFLWEKKIIALF